MKNEEQEIGGWEKLADAVEKGEVPRYCITSKATAESCLTREHFEMLDAYRIQIRLSSAVPPNQVAFL